MAINAYREANSTDLILRMTSDVLSLTKFEAVSKIVDTATDFLAKEYVQQHQQEILAQIDLQVIINTLSIKIAEQVTEKLFGGTSEKA